MHAQITDFVLDIFHNAAEAGSSIIRIEIKKNSSNIAVSIKDNGPGMDPLTLEKVLDPFYSDGKKHEKRRVGLGLPFLKQAVEATGGDFRIDSGIGSGTDVFFAFLTDHLDCPPQGDLVELFFLILTFSSGPRIHIAFEDGSEELPKTLDSAELREILGNLDTVAELNLLKTYIAEWLG